MKPKKRTKKSVAWYRREVRRIGEIADEALDSRDTERRAISLVAIAALAAEAAIGREAYLER